MDIQLIKEIFQYAGPGVGMGFFLGWYFFSKQYFERALDVIDNNTKALFSLKTMIEDRMKND